MTKLVVGKGSVGIYRRMWMFSVHALGGLRRTPITITAPPPVVGGVLWLRQRAHLADTYLRPWMYAQHRLRRMPITITGPSLVPVYRVPWAIQMKHLLGR